ncbi:MAG: hypothetical protein QOH06_575 [Acidobacteriota bacterium]|jgi:hypothetical protein|nr:hypothetical protein [Acidobacteriota bacterium]
MKNTHRAWSLVAMLLLLSPLAAFAQVRNFNAQGQGPYQDLQIQVKDLDSDQVITTVQPGGTITLREGQRVRLIMTADHPGQKGIIYPETEFTEADPGRGWVRVTKTNVDNANATLRIVRPSGTNRSRTETLSYRIVESIGTAGIRDSLRQGTINVRVEPAAAAGSSPTSVPTRQQARDLTDRLYQAILMRKLDETGARTHIDNIAKGGYQALIQVAERIAESDESRIGVYEREGVCNQQRLLSMYKNLLGMSASQIDREQWEEDLRRMNAGDIDAVVAGMVRSPRFQQLHNLERMAIRY